MSIRRILFLVTAAASCNGTTVFAMPNTPAASSNGQLVYTVDAASGPLGRLSQTDQGWRSVTGSGPYHVRLALNNNNNAVTRFTIGLLQPQPTIAYLGGLDPVMLGRQPSTLALVNALQPFEMHVPEGCILMLRGDNGTGGDAGVRSGPYEVALEVSTITTPAQMASSLARAGYQQDVITMNT
jgi:hypothetical protein